MNWLANAACTGVNPNIFFPDYNHEDADAKTICAACPVRSQCLDHFINERFGVFGGLNATERRAERRRRRMNGAA